ncbi:MAG: hypothetical protein R3D67_10920 [Hyphomicrobiaceae bacterium]
MLVIWKDLVVLFFDETHARSLLACGLTS